jgi:hypothetical protein
VATRPAVPAAASLRNFRRPTGFSDAFAMDVRVQPSILANGRTAVKTAAYTGRGR